MGEIKKRQTILRSTEYGILWRVLIAHVLKGHCTEKEEEEEMICVITGNTFVGPQYLV